MNEIIKIYSIYSFEYMVETEEDLIKVFDSFCENLLEVALLENPKDRHPDYLQLEEIFPTLDLDTISKNFKKLLTKESYFDIIFS